MKLKYSFLWLSILLVAGIILFIPTVNVLEISNRKNQNEKIISRAAYKNGFIISYTHSVNKGRVHDYYKTTEKNKIELYKTEFKSYGAGIPEPYETEDAQFIVGDDSYFITNLHRVLPKLVMAVGVVAKHSIAIGTNSNTMKEIFLTEYFSPQTSLIFEIKKVSLLQMIITNKI